MGSTGQRWPVPTFADVGTTQSSRRARNYRRLGVAALLAVVVAASLGLLGPTSGSTARTGPHEERVEVEFPDRTRPGIDSEVMVKLTLASPVTGDVVLTVDQAMYDHLGLDRVVPEPASQQSDGDRVRLTFDPPEGRVLSVTFGGRLSTQQVPGAYRFDLAVEAPGSEAVETSFRTWVLP